MVKITALILFFALLVACGKSKDEEITIYFNGAPLRVSVDGHSLESFGGHNYKTGIVYEMKRVGKDIVLNVKYDQTPPQPAFDSNSKIIFECDGKPCEMIGDTVVLFTIAEGDTINVAGKLFYIGMK